MWFTAADIKAAYIQLVLEAEKAPELQVLESTPGRKKRETHEDWVRAHEGL